jgi:hypothetical protein
MYVHFAIDRDANLQPVLHALKDTKYIGVHKDKMVTITASGLNRIEEMGYGEEL